MKHRNKHILLGIIIGIFCTTLVFFLIGDVEIETEFKFGGKSVQENENVKVNIEKEISYVDTIKVEDIKALSINGKEIISIETETITREKLIELLLKELCCRYGINLLQMKLRRPESFSYFLLMQTLFLLAAAIFPQGEVLVDAAVESASVQAGATIELRVGMDIPAGWHVYHPDQDSAEGITVSVEVEGAEAAGKLACDKAPRVHRETIGSKVYETLWLFGSPEFTLPIKVEGPPGVRTLGVEVGWQICNESLCLPPESTFLSVSLEVLPGEAGAVKTEGPEVVPGAGSVQSRVQEKMAQEALSGFDDLSHVEIPQKLALLTTPFSIEDGTLTLTDKVRRRVVQDRYASLIDRFYLSENANRTVFTP